MPSSVISKPTSKATSSGTSSHKRRHHKHKSLLRPFVLVHSLNAIFSFISICLFAAIVPLWNANFFHTSGLLKGDWPDGLALLPLSITIIVSICYLIKTWLSHQESVSTDYHKSRSKSSSMPTRTRTQLYLTLTILTLLLTFLILAGVSGLYRFWRPSVITSVIQSSSGTAYSSLISSLTYSRRDISDANPTSLTPPAGAPGTASTQKPELNDCTLANVFTRKCNPTLYLLGDLQLAAIAAGSLVWLLNLILLVLQAREHQYQKRKHQRSLRAKAKAKMDWVEDEWSRAEKGAHHGPKKKIHHERRRAPSGPPHVTRSDSSADPSQSNVTRPKQAHTIARPDLSRNDSTSSTSTVRPKQHYYNPEITPSRSRSTREPPQAQTRPTIKPWVVGSQTPYSLAVEEARRKMKPAETMGDWLDKRYT